MWVQNLYAKGIQVVGGKDGESPYTTGRRLQSYPIDFFTTLEP